MTTIEQTEQTTPTIQDVAVERALRMLDAAGAQYAVLYNEQKYGTLELAPPPKQRRKGPGMYPPGTLRAHFLPRIGDLQPGEVGLIPYDNFDVAVLQSNVAAFCSAAWGSQSYITRRFDLSKELHVLRFS